MKTKSGFKAKKFKLVINRGFFSSNYKNRVRSKGVGVLGELPNCLDELKILK